MSSKWPSFETKDLGDSEADWKEFNRRFEAYEREMRALIAKGGVHQDEDGWWVDDATGELIGEDPDMIRPLTPKEVSEFQPRGEWEAKRKGGRPALGDKAKKHVSLRLDADVLDKFKATGKGWQGRINEALRRARV